MRIGITILLAFAWLPAFASAAAPAHEAQPMPPLDQLIDRMLDRAHLEVRNDHDFKQLYAYRLIRTKDEFDGKGTLRKRNHRNRTHEPDPNTEPTLLLEPDPVPDPDIIHEEIDEAKAAAEMQSGRAFDKSDFPISRDLVNRFALTIVGRDLSGERPMLIVDFQPASRKLPVRQFKDKFINRAAGRVWVDESDWAVARAELRLSEPVHVVGGLVGSVRRFRYSMVRERTPDGLWYPTNISWRLEGRQVLARKAIEYHERREDIRLARPVHLSHDMSSR
jgi:hypothetical protein